MRLLGVDPGARRIGLAVSDPDAEFASPHATVDVQSRARAAHDVAAAAARLEVTKIVVGLPLRLDGSESESSRLARAFAEELRSLTGLEVVLWDERLSSRAAERALREGGVRRNKRRQTVDRVAAALILQSYIDAQRERERDADDGQR
jgi:putative Holliday junction resolvase